MTDADNILAAIRIQIWINPEIQIRIPDHLVEVWRLGGGWCSLSTV